VARLFRRSMMVSANRDLATRDTLIADPLIADR
jgi:hypothetical protein